MSDAAAVAAPARGGWRGWLAFVLLLAAIEVSYVYVVSAGTMKSWPAPSAYGDQLAEGFRQGHLYLPRQPPPALIAAQDPYDVKNARVWGMWDASFYGKHYYLYWGPLPSLVIAGVKSLLRISRPVGDQYAVFVELSIRLIAGSLLIAAMARRLFPRLPAALVGLGVLVFAYANPTLYVLARGAIYESAIAGGQAFLMIGLVFAFHALWKREADASPRPALVAAGTAWGLGLACRVSIGPVVALLALASAALAGPRAGRSWRRALGDLAAVSAPVVALVAVLLAYNKARFESWFDFGVGRQLSSMSFRTSWHYLAPNLYSYLWRPLEASCRFPFLVSPWQLNPKAFGTAFPSGWVLPEGYWTKEPVAGVLVAVPWTIFALAAAPLGARDAWRGWRAAGDAGLDQVARAKLWCLVSFLSIACVSLLPVMRLFIATMRYLEDVIAGITLLGILGAWTLHDRVKDQVTLRRVLLAAIVLVALATIAIGLLLGVQGYEDLFARRNPLLWQRWVDRLSLCHAPPPRP